MIKLQIDVKKIDKDKLFKGEKGVYLNAVLIETPNSEHSDYMIVEETTKEEREAGNKGTILGNAKILVKQNQELSEEDKSDLPF
jgi:hypothetical protein